MRKSTETQIGRAKIVATTLLGSLLLAFSAGTPVASATPSSSTPITPGPSQGTGRAVPLVSYPPGTVLNEGWRMNNNQAVLSPDDFNEFVLLRGLLEVWHHGDDHVWTATQSGAGDYVTLQTDGNLVVYTSANKAVWSARTEGQCSESGYNCVLDVQNDGNVVIYRTNGSAVWATGTA